MDKKMMDERTADLMVSGKKRLQEVFDALSKEGLSVELLTELVLHEAGHLCHQAEIGPLDALRMVGEGVVCGATSAEAGAQELIERIFGQVSPGGDETLN